MHRVALTQNGFHRNADRLHGALGRIQRGVGLCGGRTEVLRLAVGEIGPDSGERIGIDDV